MSAFTYSGSWNGNLGNQTFWGLSRNVGPWKTTPLDQVRANSRPGKYYANAGAWYSSENPGPFIPTTPPSKPYRYHDLDLVGGPDFKPPMDLKVPRISGRGPKKVVGDKSTGFSRGGFGIGDVRDAEFGALGPGNEAQPARTQTTPKKYEFPARKMSRDMSIDDTFEQNSRRGSTVSASASSSSQNSSYQSAVNTPMRSGAYSILDPAELQARLESIQSASRADNRGMRIAEARLGNFGAGLELFNRRRKGVKTEIMGKKIASASGALNWITNLKREEQALKKKGGKTLRHNVDLIHRPEDPHIPGRFSQEQIMRRDSTFNEEVPKRKISFSDRPSKRKK